MKTNPRIDEEVEKTLHALDGIERASPKPFFKTRAEARLNQRASAGRLTTWVYRPTWALASLGLILLLNLSAVVYMQQQLDQHEQEQDTVGLSSEWGFDTVLDW